MVVTDEKPVIRVGRTPPKPNRDLERIMAEFSGRQLDLIMSNVGAVQLTEGCSVACPFCFLDAEPFVREYIPFDILEVIANNFGARFPKGIDLYHASDPFDYDFEGHDYVGVHDLFQGAMGCSPCVSTAVPKGKEDQVIRLLMEPTPSPPKKTSALSRVMELVPNKIKLSKNSSDDYDQQSVEAPDLTSRIIWRISISFMNHKRLENAFLRHFPNLDSSKQHIAEYEVGQPSVRYLGGVRYFGGIKWIGEYAINFGFRENFGKPLGEQESALVEKIGNQNGLDLVYSRFAVPMLHYIPQVYFNEAYHKPKKNKGIVYIMDMGNGRLIYALDRPVNFIDIIGEFERMEYPPLIFENRLDIDGATINGSPFKLLNLGKRNLDNLSDISPSCFHGVLIKPDGFYNEEKVTPSRQFPTGWREERINPENFRVAKYKFSGTSRDAGPYKTLTLPRFSMPLIG